MSCKGIIYYTDNRLDDRIASGVRRQIAASNLPIVSVSLKPLEFGKNICVPYRRGYLTLFKQILVGLWAAESDYIFMCEHDVLYHPSHFEFVPQRDDVYYYNNNAYKWNIKTGQVVSYDCWWLSQLCASRKILIEHYTRKIQIIESEGKKLWNWRFEPGTKRGIDTYQTRHWKSDHPNIDIRHGKNLTGMKRFHPSEFRGNPDKVCPNFKETSLDKLSGWNNGAFDFNTLS